MDVLSRIILQAQGGDQAAREIEKVRRAYDEAGKSAKEMTAGVAAPTTDPFAAATRKALPPPSQVGGGPSPTAGFAKDPMEGARQRMAEHATAVGVQRVTGAGVGITQAAARGDIPGAAAGGLAAAAPLLGAAAPFLLAAGLAVKGVGMLAGNEYERVQQLYQSGLSQQLGIGYTPTRELALQAARHPTGIPSERAIEMLQALAGAGGRVTGQFMPMAERMAQWGIAPAAMGNVMATMQRMGFQGGVSERTMGILAGSFGYGRVAPAMQSISQLLEDAMARGSDRAGEMLSKGTLGVASRLAGYASAGLSMEGAVGLYRQMDQTYSQVTRLQTPLDVMSFRAMRKPGEAMFETLLRMEKDTERTGVREYELLKERYGGNLNTVKMVMMRGRGLTAAQAEAYVAVREGVVPPPPVAPTPVADEFAQTFTRARQYQALAGAEEQAAKAITWIFNFLSRIGETISQAGGEASLETAVEGFQRTRGALPTGPKGQQQLYMEYGAALMAGNQERANEILEGIQQSMQSIDSKLDGVLSDEGATE